MAVSGRELTEADLDWFTENGMGLTATFPGAKSVTVYRKGEKTVVNGGTLTLTLDNREGVFVTVDSAFGPIC